MIKDLICEISESDFRKLNIIGKRSGMRVDPANGYRYFAMEDVSLNGVLDGEIAGILEGGWPDQGSWLSMPVTVAIHEEGDPADPMSGIYLDKFMNRFTGAQTFQIGFGIRHLYSTRNWLEDREDYWRVNKKETRVVYRVRLDPKWAASFAPKHRYSREPWPYDELPEGVSPDGMLSCELAIREDLSEDGSWVEACRTCEVRYERSEAYIPVDAEGHSVKPHKE